MKYYGILLAAGVVRRNTTPRLAPPALCGGLKQRRPELVTRSTRLYNRVM